MISEGSCDTEDRSIDAENSALITGINYILKYIQIEIRYFKMGECLTLVLCMWCAYLTNPKLLNGCV